MPKPPSLPYPSGIPFHSQPDAQGSAPIATALHPPLDFTQRADLATHPESMDGPCTFAQLRDCLHDIARVNRLTRAYAPTLHWLNHVYRVMPLQSRPVHIVDVGCGYGDMLRRIHRWARERNLPVTLTGIDLNPDAVRAAREVTLPGTVTYLAGDAYAFNPAGGIDIVISSLLTHHLENPQIIEFLDWMEARARLGWFVNDLHRQPLPYHAFRLLSPLFRLHPFVRHDGPVSILRSFRRQDWLALCRQAALPPNEILIREYRPARLCVARVRDLRLRKT